MNPPARYRCAKCRQDSSSWAAAERHADAEHHHRIEVIVRPEEKEPPMSPKQSIRRDRREGEKRMGPPPRTKSYEQPPLVAAPETVGDREARLNDERTRP